MYLYNTWKYTTTVIMCIIALIVCEWWLSTTSKISNILLYWSLTMLLASAGKISIVTNNGDCWSIVYLIKCNIIYILTTTLLWTSKLKRNDTNHQRKEHLHLCHFFDRCTVDWSETLIVYYIYIWLTMKKRY